MAHQVHDSKKLIYIRQSLMLCCLAIEILGWNAFNV